MLNQLRVKDYDIVVLNEDEPQADKACGSVADGKGVGAPGPSRIQLKAPGQEQKASIPMWQAAFIDAALAARPVSRSARLQGSFYHNP